MALNSDPQIGLRELWDLGIPPIEACSRYASEKGYAIGAMGALIAVLQSFNSTFRIIQEYGLNSSGLSGKTLESANKITTQQATNELNARKWLIRELNSGQQIAIGRRAYSGDRADLRYVWDGRLSDKRFNWAQDSYSGPKRLFSAIRILSRSSCPDYWLRQFDRLRTQPTGRPKFESLSIAIERVADRDPKFDEPTYFKTAVFLVEGELEKMRDCGETTEVPARMTIEKAIRKKNSNSS